MWGPWQQWEQFAVGHRAVVALGRNGMRRERRIVPDRTNPFTAMTDCEFTERFRLRKESVNDIIIKISDHLPHSTDKRGKQFFNIVSYLLSAYQVNCTKVYYFYGAYNYH